jgi:hypothetical protein
LRQGRVAAGARAVKNAVHGTIAAPSPWCACYHTAPSVRVRMFASHQGRSIIARFAHFETAFQELEV